MPSLEICTGIGCSVGCTKYCPQEIFTRNYRGERRLSFDGFKEIISTVPPEVTLIFAGISEPMLNQSATDMILYASAKGHKIQLLTTLVGLTLQDAEDLVVVPFDDFILHLPDVERNARIPQTPEYFAVQSHILANVSRIRFMNMGGYFATDHSEDMIRGNPLPKKQYRITCDRMEDPAYFVLPNGAVYYCIMTKGQSHKIGSLYTCTWDELTAKLPVVAKELKADKDSICYQCCYAQPYWLHKLVEIKMNVLGKKKLFEVRI